MSPKTVLEHAEKLYQKGFVSYPRTETDMFDKDFDFMELIGKQTTDEKWGAFATQLQSGGFERPRNGRKNDQAHPPIHPTAHASNLAADEKRVYELITRRFLACCSKNGVGRQRTVEVQIAGEFFNATGLIVLERNYLDVYPYDSWSSSALPDFQQGETFMPSVCELKEGQTSAPSLLTEADLVSLMDKNGIGTDATIAEHIATIIAREYAIRQKQGTTEYLVPSTLGCGLIHGYNSLGFDKSLSKPHLRRETEQRMAQICDGLRSKREVVDESVEQYREVFAKSRRDFSQIIASVERYLNMPLPATGHENNARRGDRQGPIDLDTSSDDDGGGDDFGPGPRGGRGNQNRRGSGAKVSGTRQIKASTRTVTTGQPPSRAKRKRETDDQTGGEAPSASTPLCICGNVAVERTVTKESDNKGRMFFSCSKPREESCGFFEWADALAPSAKATRRWAGSSIQTNNERPASRPRAGSTDHKCDCDLVAVQRTVSKEGPNQGRKFWMCPNVSKSAQCRFFLWDDEAGGPTNLAGSPSNAAASNYSCFKCGEQGHFSNQCSGAGAAGSSFGGGSRTTRGRGRGRGRSSSRARGKSSGRGRGRKTLNSTYRPVDSD